MLQGRYLSLLQSFGRWIQQLNCAAYLSLALDPRQGCAQGERSIHIDTFRAVGYTLAAETMYTPPDGLPCQLSLLGVCENIAHRI